MILDFVGLHKKYDFPVKGVIVAGAHHGQEYNTFMACGARVIAFFEPQGKSFKILKENHGSKPHVTLHETALGNKHTVSVMYTESDNQGQSSSLLQPELHKDYYPDIVFDNFERVNVKTLDSYFSELLIHNVLYMDVQGYELEVLKGAQITLNFIDVIYTEVNNQELYEGCAKVWQIDELLKSYGFERVETGEWNHGWTDALYLKNK